MTSDNLDIRVDAGSDIPLVAQLRRRIAWLIATHALRPGQQLPSIRELGRSVGVHHHTVRAAYRQLAADGLLDVRRGVGASVRPYSSLQLARRPAVSATMVLGVLIAGYDPFYLPFLRGIESVADRLSALTVVCVTEDSPIKAKVQVGQLVAQGVDGIVVASVGSVVAEELRPVGRAAGIPIVYCDQPDLGDEAFLFDGARGMEEAAAHLAGHGHRRVAFLGPWPELPNVAALVAGIRRVVARGDLETVEQVPVEPYTIEAAERAMAPVLAGGDHPSAVIAAADVLAFGALAAARAARVPVPEALAVVGYGDLDVAGLVHPPLTTVAMPVEEMGRLAAERLARLISGDAAVPEVIALPTRLVIRRSCGCREESPTT